MCGAHKHSRESNEHLIRKALYIDKDREGYRTPYYERDHRFYVVGRYNRSSGVVKPASEARAVSAVADGAGGGLCAPAARGGRERRRAAERAEAGDSGAERGEGSRERAQGRETASPMVLRCGILWESR